MDNSKFIFHKGKEIFILDCTDCGPEMVHNIIDECAKQVQSRPEKSVRTLTIATNAKFDGDTINKLKDLTKGNAPYVETAACVGITGLYKVLITAVTMFSKREFHMFDKKEEALDFLAG